MIHLGFMILDDVALKNVKGQDMQLRFQHPQNSSIT
jgi:hypothetical protein